MDQSLVDAGLCDNLRAANCKSLSKQDSSIVSTDDIKYSILGLD